MKSKQVLNDAHGLLKSLTFIKVARFCLYAFAVFIPFQVRFFFQLSDLYQGGQINQFTSFFLYFSDILLVFALICSGLATVFQGYNLKSGVGDRRLFAILLVMIFLIEVSSFWAIDPLASFVTMIRFVEFLIFYLLFLNLGCSMRLFGKILIFTLALQSLIAVFQYIFQSSLGLSFFGESLLSIHQPGVAKIDLGQMQFLRSYGTFVHPNVFGGFLVVGILLAFTRQSEDKLLYRGLIGIMALALLLTFSRSAWIALLFSGIFYIFVSRPKLKIKYLFSGLLIFLIFLFAFDLDQLFINRIFPSNDLSLSERIGYMNISKDMFLSHPFGVGIGNFTLEMQNFSDRKLAPWLLQPVHNIFLLALNEVGVLILPVIGFLFYYIFISVYQKGQKFVSGGDRRYGIMILSMLFAFLVLSGLDHYPISLYQGQFLFFFYLLLVNDFLIRKVSV